MVFDMSALRASEPVRVCGGSSGSGAGDKEMSPLLLEAVRQRVGYGRQTTEHGSSPWRDLIFG